MIKEPLPGYAAVWPRYSAGAQQAQQLNELHQQNTMYNKQCSQSCPINSSHQTKLQATLILDS